MRRKNRQLKMLVDIPEKYDNDEDFLMDLQDKLDEADWKMTLPSDTASVNCVTMGDLKIEPEE